MGSLTLPFHPDWPYAGGLVIESMARRGTNRSQFETGTSNGGLTVHPGGDRWRWESRLFDGRYDGAPDGDRPVYGAWNSRDDPYGGAIRFGSAYARLRADLLDRCTFCFPDSVLEPTDFGGPDALPHLSALADAARFDDLDECVEAHVHGGVVFERDVEAVVLDPCFRDTKVEAAAAELGCAVEWHPGLRVSSSGLDPDYRGQEFVDLARSLGDVLTPDRLGDAARSGAHDAQSVKRVWHYLARFGRSPV
ncbi:uncharacterized protein DUF3626 [Nocardioides albertanoniae]|uniref:Uncharacterized protein DUF3626 n=1 Tax=Nocardioides albertanoniae TaxID=1175486 RepID=A0A543ABP9_9ACTN|nr:DUF3626 domain-containing protein [Nocardioides albertanoniae]TQL70023.1 uncharacterized protein DUF3626 [Nocardioides albertanoniae]